MNLLQIVQERLQYNPDTGELRWRVSNGRRAVAGQLAGSVFNTNRGYQYRRIEINHKSYLAHRLVWLLHFGEFPPNGMAIDHINGNSGDNRICNLRLATHAQNCRNQKPKSGAAVPLKGVSKVRNKYRAHICVNKKLIHLGYFATAEEAHAAYCEAAAQHHREFARTV